MPPFRRQSGPRAERSKPHERAHPRAPVHAGALEDTPAGRSLGWPTKVAAGEWDNGADENLVEPILRTSDFFEFIQGGA
jgi:hypothetical protein